MPNCPEVSGITFRALGMRRGTPGPVAGAPETISRSISQNRSLWISDVVNLGVAYCKSAGTGTVEDQLTTVSRDRSG